MTDTPDSGGTPKKPHMTRADFEARAQATRADVEAQMRATKAQIDHANEKIQARTGRNLVAAIAIGIGLGALLIASLIIFPWLFIIFAGFLIGFTVFELSSALRFAGRDVPRVASIVVGVSVAPAAFFWGVTGLWLGVLAAIAVVTLWRVAELVRPSHRGAPRAVVADLAAGAFVQLYVTFLAGFYLVLTGSPGGQWWTLAAIVIVVVTDIGAYASGLTFGKHLMAPTISPKKTWEGFAGAVLAAVIAGLLLSWLMLHEPLWVGAFLGVVLMLVATMGDLAESLIKRDLGVKDMSTWLPGHGGFLDRLDSILPAAAVIYLFYVVYHH